MRPRIKPALLPFVSLIAVTFATADAEQSNRKDFKIKKEFTSGHGPLNGLKIYYEIHGVPDDSIRAITAPTLVVCGDTDVVRPEHAVALTRLLPHAQLAILPGTDHAIMLTRADHLAPMGEAFLNAPMPAGQ